MTLLIIATGTGHQSDVKHRGYDRTVTVGKIRDTVKGTPGSAPVILRHNGENMALTGTRTDGREGLTLIAGPLESWAKIERIRNNTLTAGDLGRALKSVPDSCKVVVRYKEGGTGAVYGIEKQVPPPPDTVPPQPEPAPEPEPQPLPYMEEPPRPLIVYRLALIAGEMDGGGLISKRAGSLTVKELRKGIEDLPKDLRVIVITREKTAALEDIRRNGEDLKIRPGTFTISGAQNAAENSKTTGELLDALQGLPDDGRIFAGLGTETAAVYGFQKLTRPEA